MRLIERWILSGKTTPTLGVIATRTARWCIRGEGTIPPPRRHLVRCASRGDRVPWTEPLRRVF
jgi:hypothetical protein